MVMAATLYICFHAFSIDYTQNCVKIRVAKHMETLWVTSMCLLLAVLFYRLCAVCRERVQSALMWDESEFLLPHLAGAATDAPRSPW